MIFVDTTILVYAAGGEHPLKASSERLFSAVVAGAIDATTTPEVIQEFVHARSRRSDRREAVSVARNYARVLSPLLPSEEAALSQALSLFERHAALGSFDALLASTAIAHGAEALVSADAAFGGIPRLRHVAPGTPEFEGLLAA